MNSRGRVASAARPSRAAALAPAVFVLLWSTGFVVARYGTRDAEPMTFLAIRLGIAATLLAVVATVMRAPRPDRITTRWVAVVGVCMHALYLGGVFIAIHLGMPSGVSALIAGLHPVITSLGARGFLHERLSRRQCFGITLGFAGVVGVVLDRLSAHSSGITAGALVASGISVLGMSGGTMLQRRHGSTMPLLWGTVVQYAAATTVLTVGALTVEHAEIRFTARAVFSLTWAILVLSVAAVLLMLWLLQQQAAAQVSSLFFLTPALSTIEGAVLFDERLGVLAVAGLIVSLCGVALITRERV